VLVYAATIVRLECSFHLSIMLFYVVTHRKREMVTQKPFLFGLQNYGFLLKQPRIIPFLLTFSCFSIPLPKIIRNFASEMRFGGNGFAQRLFLPTGKSEFK
jgi:hypothetical protein